MSAALERIGVYTLSELFNSAAPSGRVWDAIIDGPDWFPRE